MSKCPKCKGTGYEVGLNDNGELQNCKRCKGTGQKTTPVKKNPRDYDQIKGVPRGEGLFSVGDRIEMHPATDWWMRGARYGEIRKIKFPVATVKLDKVKRLVRVHFDNLMHIKSDHFTRNPKTPRNEAAVELALFIENDGDLYRQQTLPIIHNLQRKIKSRVYDPQKALKLWGYLAESGAKKYLKHFGSPGDKWFEMFSPATRKQVAKLLAERYSEHVNENPRRRKAARGFSVETGGGSFVQAYHGGRGKRSKNLGPKKIRAQLKKIYPPSEGYRIRRDDDLTGEPRVTRVKRNPRKIQVTTITAPVYWASYLVNGDASGLQPGEKAHVDAWLKKQEPWHIVSTADEEPHFTWNYELYGGQAKGGDVIDYVAHKYPSPSKISRIKREAVKRNPVGHFVVVANLSRGRKMYYRQSSGSFIGNTKDATQYKSRAMAKAYGRQLLSRLPSKVHSLTVGQL